MPWVFLTALPCEEGDFRGIIRRARCIATRLEVRTGTRALSLRRLGLIFYQ